MPNTKLPTLAEVAADVEAARVNYEEGLAILLKYRRDLAYVEGRISVGGAVDDPSLYSSQRNLLALVKDLEEGVAGEKKVLEQLEGRQRRMQSDVAHLQREFAQLIPDSQQEMALVAKMRRRALRENDQAALQRIAGRETRVRATVGYWLGLLHQVGAEGAPASVDEALARKA